MLQYIFQRFLYMLVTLFAVSIVSFVIIELPPGDHLTSYAAQLAASGDTVDQAQLDSATLKSGSGWICRSYQCYFKWVTDMMQGDFGIDLPGTSQSRSLIRQWLGMTLMITITALLFTWVLGFIIGVFSGGPPIFPWRLYLHHFLVHLRLGIPDFLLALVLMWVGFRYFGANVGGLISHANFRISPPWSWAKFVEIR